MRREDPFRPNDRQETEPACRRVAAASDFISLWGWRADAGYLVF